LQYFSERELSVNLTVLVIGASFANVHSKACAFGGRIIAHLLPIYKEMPYYIIALDDFVATEAGDFDIELTA
jgi:hypothetical protein